MDTTLQRMVQAIHAAGCRIAMVLTGGGSAVVGELLSVAGGSRSLVEASVPYSAEALAEYLGGVPEHFCSVETAVAMARRAYLRAGRLDSADQRRLGIAATASLVSDRPKRGAHRCHAAACDGQQIVVHSLVLCKGARDRTGEEAACARLVLNLLAGVCGVPESAELSLHEGEQVTKRQFAVEHPILALLAGAAERIRVAPDGRMCRAAAVPPLVFPGSFNPVHAAHRALAELAARRVGAPAAFELSVVNVDKRPLVSERVLGLRLRQFEWWAAVELTRAATFLEKSLLFPGATFLLGADTAERLVDVKYYGSATGTRDSALDTMAHRGCRFLVAARPDAAGVVRTLADIPIPDRYRSLFDEIPASEFCSALSSTALRAAATAGGVL